MEVWKQVVGSERYRVSNKGRVWDDKRDKEVSRVITGADCGRYYYVNVQLPHGRKLVKCSRLVAEAFIPNPDNLPVVDHINRDKFDDRVENLRWVTYSENNQNRDDSIIVEYRGETIHLVNLVKRLFGEDYLKAYGSIIQHISRGVGIEEALDRYVNPDDYTGHNKQVVWEGQTIVLFDLLKQLGKESGYEDVLSRLRRGWDTWSAIYNCPPIPETTLSIVQDDGTSLSFSSKNHLVESSGRSREVVNQALEKGWTYQYMLNYQYDGRQLYEINGVSRTKEEWYKVYKTREPRVSAKMTKLGISFVEAVQLPKERVSSLLLNGNKISVKSLWDIYDINPKAANNTKRLKGFTYIETLSHYGVDTADLHIEEL